MKSLKLCFIVLLYWTVIVQPYSLLATEYLKLPSTVDNTIPPSPTPYQIQKCQEHPMSYSLGTPNISIPLYDVKTKELSLPISLTYNTSGIKVDEISGVMGLGWTLHVGGVITRNIIGMPDDVGRSLVYYKSPQKLESDLEKNNMTQYLDSIRFNRLDGTRDIFHYSFGSESGSFIVDCSTPLTQIITLRNKKHKISCRRDNAGRIRSFTIVDNYGISYLFSAEEIVDKYEPKVPGLSLQYSSTNYNATSSWYLTKITSANKTDVIDLTYEPGDKWTHYSTSSYAEYVIQLNTDKARVDPVDKNISFSYVKREYSLMRLSSIKFNGDNITFGYNILSSNTIAHFPLNNYMYKNNTPKSTIKSIIISNNINTIRKITFSQSAFPDGRMKLDDVVVTGRSQSYPIDKYQFTYLNANHTIMNHSAQDFFGYYNGKDSNKDLLFLGFNLNESDKRAYSFNNAQTYSLSTISDAAGVTTKFSYEPNLHQQPRVVDLHIGIRVKSISVYDALGLIKERKFMYENSNTTIDFGNINQTCFITRSEHGVSDDPHQIPREAFVNLLYSDHSVLPGASIENARVFYGKVTEMIVGRNNRDSLKLVYEYDHSSSYHPFKYTLANVPENSNNISFHKFLEKNDLSIYTEIIGYFIEKSLVFDNLIKKTTYRTIAPGQYEVVEEEQNTYHDHKVSSNYAGIYVKSVMKKRLQSYRNMYDIGETSKDISNLYYFPIAIQGATKYDIYSSVHTKYYQSGPIVDSTHYIYFPVLVNAWPDKPYVIIRDTVITASTASTTGATSAIGDYEIGTISKFSNGDEYVHRIFRPTSYQRESIYSTMCDNNMLVVTGESISKNDKCIKGQHYRYDKFSFDDKVLILPKYSVVIGDDDTVSRITYHKYDNTGNLLCVSQDNLAKTCYIWGYNGSKIVAEIKNAEYEQVVNAMGNTMHIQAISSSLGLTNAMLDRLHGLREKLSESQVTIYTYTPLVGVTSITDPSGRCTTYHYDGQGRLNAIKDENNNLIESYEYCTYVN